MRTAVFRFPFFRHRNAVPDPSTAAGASLSKPAAASSAADQWDEIIRPREHLLRVNFRELWDYRDLLALFVKRDIVTVYKQTILGPLWYFIQPILTTIVFSVVFGGIAGISTDGVPGPLFYLGGITIWNYFSDVFDRTAGTFTNNAAIFGKVYFPRLVVPVSVVISGLIRFFIQMGLFLSVLIWYAATGSPVRPGVWAVLSIWCVAVMAGLGLGLGILFTSLTTKYRDLRFLLTFAVQLLMYASPIIYPMSLLNESRRQMMWWNPVAHVVEWFRFGFTGTGLPSVGGLLYTSLFTAATLFAGIIVFNRTERTFMDTV